METQKSNNPKKRNQDEQKIVNYFKNNNGIKLEELESGLVLYEECKRKVGKFAEETLYLTKEKIDIPCFNKNDNDIVIVEVKSEIANYNTFGQILYYLTIAEGIACANTELGKSNINTVRGIILAKEINESLKKLVNKYKNATPKINLKEYDWGAAKNLIIKDVL